MRSPMILPDLVIANGGTTSSAISAERLRYLDSINIWGPAALTGTVTVEVSYDGTNYGTLQSAGSDVAVAATKVVTVLTGGFYGLRVKSDGAEGAARTFQVRGTEKLGL